MPGAVEDTARTTALLADNEAVFEKVSWPAAAAAGLVAPGAPRSAVRGVAAGRGCGRGGSAVCRQGAFAHAQGRAGQGACCSQRGMGSNPCRNPRLS